MMAHSAAIAVTAILLCAGAASRVLESRLNRRGGSVAIAPAALRAIPMQLGDWRGEDTPLSRAVVEATDAEVVLNRTYARTDAGALPGAVEMFVGYGGRFRDLVPHRPEVCFPGAGWNLVTQRTESVELAHDHAARCRIYHFSKGGLGREQMAVLSLFVIDGHFAPDLAALRLHPLRPRGPAPFIARVQLSLASPDPEKAEAMLRDFAAVAAPVVRDTLMAAVERTSQEAGDE